MSALGAAPVASQPILVIRDSGATSPYQNYVPEILTTEGIQQFQVAELADVTSAYLAQFDAVILPSLSLTSTQAQTFDGYVRAGGILVAFRPDLQLAATFGVTPLHTTASEAWLKLDTRQAGAAGLEAEPIRFHGAADLYAAGTAAPVANIYQTWQSATANPAVAVNALGSGRAILFAYDLPRTIVAMRQGNPAWAGYPNTHDGYVSMRPSQMFLDLATNASWNSVGDGSTAEHRNDVPQADVQMHLVSNLLVLHTAALRPEPRLWLMPDQKNAVMIMTGDNHVESASEATAEIDTVEGFGGSMSLYLFQPFTTFNQAQAASWVSAGHEVSAHFDDTGEVDGSGVGGSKVTFAGMSSLVDSTINGMVAKYPALPAPRTTRNHFLLWASTDENGNPDATAQARIFAAHGIELDTSFASFPGSWGYMTGSGLPMRFLDVRKGNIIPVYEQATQYEDDIQLGSGEYGLAWDYNTALGHYQRSLGDNATTHHGAVTFLFHPDAWNSYGEPVAWGAMEYAQAQGVAIWSADKWLTFWKARANTSLSNIVFSSSSLSFNVANAPAGLTLMVPRVAGKQVVTTLQVDGANQAIAGQTRFGLDYATFSVGAGSHRVTATYTPMYSVGGQISPADAALSATVTISGTGGTQTATALADGSYRFESVGSGSYTVSASAPGYTFTPASAAITVSGADVSGVNFAGTAPVVVQSLFTSQTPQLQELTDGGPLELGMKFTSDVAGEIRAVRFWKTSSESGPHVGRIWSSTGQLLASATFTGETASGWQQQALPAPLRIVANTVYVVSVNTGNTFYVATNNGLVTQIVNQHLRTVLASNGVYGDAGTFPTLSWMSSNYFRDVVFSTGFSHAASGSIAPATMAAGATISATGPQTATATVDASGNFTVAGLADGTYTFTPAKPGYVFTPASQTATISGADVSGISFVIAQLTYSVSGTITPATTAAGTTVTLGGAAAGTTAVDASGNYSFIALPNGSYTVTPSKTATVFTPQSRAVAVNGANVSSINFTAAAVFSISGNLSANGANANVSLTGAATANTTADSAGNYSFGSLPAGQYTVTPGKPGFSFTPPSQNATVSTANVSGLNFTAQVLASAKLAIDARAWKDGTVASTTIATPAFSTTAGNELLLALVAADYRTGSTTVTRIAGAGLTWTLVRRTNAQRGSAEIWRAFAPAPLSNVTVTATLSQSVLSSITVLSYTGVDTGGTNGAGAIGASGTGNARSGAPTASLVTTRNGSWVFGVGNDYDHATARTPSAGQSLVHQVLTGSGETFWVQMQNSPTPLTGTTVSISDTAPTADRYNLSIVEVLPALTAAVTYSLSGTISPSTAGAGATVTLSGASSATTIADASGNFSFSGLANGVYTVAPSRVGYTFTPASQSVTINGANLTGLAFTAQTAPTYAVSGTISPAAAGSGATVTLSGTASKTTTADTSGNYTFTGLANGNYNVSASKTGYTFTPASQAVAVNSGDITGVNFAATSQSVFPEAAGWYAGDMHTHRSCGGSPVTVSSMYNGMATNDLAAISLLADMGNAEVQNATTDLPLVNGSDASISTAGRLLHWDAEWHWDAVYTQYPHQALGGHIVALGLTEAHQIWDEMTSPIFNWAHQQNAIAGFAHFQYFDDTIPQTLDCCKPLEYPVEIALHSGDFISADVAGSDSFLTAYYRLLNSGFRPGFAAGTDIPCNNGGAEGSLLTYAQTASGQLTYRGWIDAIAKGRTVLSRNAHNEFLDLKVNASFTPGDEIQLAAAGTVSVQVKWTSKQALSGTIELVKNGAVVASQSASVAAGGSATLTANVDFDQSGWLAARRMGSNGHQVHTAAVFVTVAGAPVRASVSDPQFFVDWIDNLLQKTSPGGAWSSFFGTERSAAQARYQSAKAVYQQIAAEAAAIQPPPPPPPPPPSGGQSIFTTQAPTTYENDSPYELGTRFFADVAGQITGVRLYTNAAEGGAHTVRIWQASTGQVLAGPYTWTIASGTEGWKSYTLASALDIAANTDYIVAISNSSDRYYAEAPNALNTAIVSGNLHTYVGSGLWSGSTGAMPNQTWQNTNYFRDVVFVAKP